MRKYLVKWLPKIIAAVALWGGVAYIILVVDPILVRDIFIEGSYIVFTLPLFLAVFYMSSVVLSEYVSSFILSGVIVLLIYLSIYNVLTIWSLVIAGVIFIYLVSQKIVRGRSREN